MSVPRNPWDPLRCRPRPRRGGHQARALAAVARRPGRGLGLTPGQSVGGDLDWHLRPLAPATSARSSCLLAGLPAPLLAATPRGLCAVAY
jgi:hypothetical protein